MPHRNAYSTQDGFGLPNKARPDTRYALNMRATILADEFDRWA